MGKVLTAYDALIAAGELRPDVEQASAAARLDVLAAELEHPKTKGLFRRRPVRRAACTCGATSGAASRC